ncbi:MAG: hypothetical protein IBX50_04880 [Marinospirillum sp.]|uniref:hypothetical protein n=1 Tax=Marinospirillum sp. TaxID=2183934 RepID=UPI0019FB267C|nr:hypothetical protein [Marinospirillum sp.]MBE0506041.1 hypothetical protein [Marinospirillum sp.]
MVDMAKLKEEALQRKRQHEEKELKKQLNKGKKPRSSSASSSRSNRGSVARNPSAQRALAKQPPQKRKRSVSRWILDILLFLGALLIMLMMINPFG